MEIQIKKQDLVNGVIAALEKAGSTEWKLYVNFNGDVALRHNTFHNDSWFEILDCYILDELENDGKYPCDNEFDYGGMAEWIVEEWEFGPVKYHNSNYEEEEAFLEIV